MQNRVITFLVFYTFLNMISWLLIWWNYTIHKNFFGGSQRSPTLFLNNTLHSITWSIYRHYSLYKKYLLHLVFKNVVFKNYFKSSSMSKKINPPHLQLLVLKNVIWITFLSLSMTFCLEIWSSRMSNILFKYLNTT